MELTASSRAFSFSALMGVAFFEPVFEIPEVEVEVGAEVDV